MTSFFDKEKWRAELAANYTGSGELDCVNVLEIIERAYVEGRADGAAILETCVKAIKEAQRSEEAYHMTHLDTPPDGCRLCEKYKAALAAAQKATP